MTWIWWAQGSSLGGLNLLCLGVSWSARAPVQHSSAHKHARGNQAVLRWWMPVMAGAMACSGKVAAAQPGQLQGLGQLLGGYLPPVAGMEAGPQHGGPSTAAC